VNPRPPLLFWCQHSVGLGHLVRSFALAAALAERFRVVLLCGGSVPSSLRPPPDIELVELPPLGIGPDGAFASHDARLTLEDARALRRRMILRTLRSLRPEAVVIELFPFGRAKFAGELLPLLEEARGQAPRPPLVACSLRDILVGRRDNQAAHDDRACRIANRYLDAVLVHSDPHFARLEDSFALRSRLRVPVHYTGFVQPGSGPRPLRRERRLVISAGGGLVGEALLTAAARAHSSLARETGLRVTMIAGPFLPESAWRRVVAAARSGDERIELLRTVTDLGTELRSARASISQCGYNTAIEILAARVPALVVPFATPEEDEQTVRARRLAELGAVRMLDPGLLQPRVLATEVRRLLDFRPRPLALDVEGAEGTARMLSELVAERAGAREVSAR
jgi:predicted glycosyltransferase